MSECLLSSHAFLRIKYEHVLEKVNGCKSSEGDTGAGNASMDTHPLARRS